MAWETVERGHFGARATSGPWSEEPCISLTKTALSLNRHAQLAVGIDREKFMATPIQNRQRVKVLLDKANQRLALVIVPPGTENSFALIPPTYRNKDGNGTGGIASGHTLQFSSRKVLTSFPTLTGTRFRVYADKVKEEGGRLALIVNLHPSFRVEV